MSKRTLGTKKQKTLAFLNTVGGLICVGGVALTVLFPNPITVAVLGGLAVLTSRKNPKKTIKKIQEKTKKNLL